MSIRSKSIFAGLIALLLVVAAPSPASAFDGRSGDTVTIPQGETVNDDLYVGASNFVMDGTVNGDVIAGGTTITINGTINGNLLAAAQTVIVNGDVTGDVLAAGSILYFGESAKVDGDVVGAGYSVEFRDGAVVARDAVMAAGQILLAGDVGRNVTAGAGALQLAGSIGGDVKAAVGEASQAQMGPSPTTFMPESPITIPVVPQGLTIDPAAKIAGDLAYTQNSELSFPGGIVGGEITRTPQPEETNRASRELTAGEKTSQWALRTMRSLITLVILGLLLLWLLPTFLSALSNQLGSRPWLSLGWGVIAYAGFVFLLLLTVFVAVLGAVVFGLFTLTSLSATIAWVGVLAVFALILGFVLVTTFLAKIVFGMTLGKWILAKAGSPLADHQYWPMIIGVAITVVVIALFSFPLIPGFPGALLNFAIVLFGLGALWLLIRQALPKQAPTTG